MNQALSLDQDPQPGPGPQLCFEHMANAVIVQRPQDVPSTRTLLMKPQDGVEKSLFKTGGPEVPAHKDCTLKALQEVVVLRASTSTSPPTTEDGHFPSLVSAWSCIIILDSVVAAAELDPLRKKNQHLVKTTRNHLRPPGPPEGAVEREQIDAAALLPTSSWMVLALPTCWCSSSSAPPPPPPPR